MNKRARIRHGWALVALGWLGVTAAPADASDGLRYWPAWRGPTGCGVAPQGDPPVEWSETKNIRWKVPIPGKGHATPIVWGKRVYIQTSISSSPAPAEKAAEAPAEGGGEPGKGDGAAAPTPPPDGPRERGGPGERERGGDRRRGRGRGDQPKTPAQWVVMALDLDTGATVWQKTVKEFTPHEGMHEDASRASGSPVTDGTHLYAYFGSFGLYCLDLNGNVLWEKDLGDMHTRNEFGEGSSPALYGDTLVVQWDHEGDDFVVALDKKTGQERWRAARDEATTWATPLVVEVNGRAQAILSATNKVRSYDLSTGEGVWELGGMTNNVIPSPVQADGVAYLMSGFRGAASRAIRLADAKGDLTDSAAVLWKYDKDTPYVPSPLLYDGRLYFLENNRAVLTCLDAKTGEKLFGPERLTGVQNVYASPVGAGGRVYVSGRDGKTVVLKAGPTFEVLATNELGDGFDASPAIVGRDLLLRSREHLYCLRAVDLRMGAAD